MVYKHLLGCPRTLGLASEVSSILALLCFMGRKAIGAFQNREITMSKERKHTPVFHVRAAVNDALCCTRLPSRHPPISVDAAVYEDTAIVELSGLSGDGRVLVSLLTLKEIERRLDFAIMTITSNNSGNLLLGLRGCTFPE